MIHTISISNLNNDLNQQKDKIKADHLNQDDCLFVHFGFSLYSLLFGWKL